MSSVTFLIDGKSLELDPPPVPPATGTTFTLNRVDGDVAPFIFAELVGTDITGFTITLLGSYRETHQPISIPASIDDAAKGEFHFEWGATDLVKGVADLEIDILPTSGDRFTVPSENTLLLVVRGKTEPGPSVLAGGPDQITIAQDNRVIKLADTGTIAGAAPLTNLGAAEDADVFAGVVGGLSGIRRFKEGANIDVIQNADNVEIALIDPITPADGRLNIVGALELSSHMIHSRAALAANSDSTTTPQSIVGFETSAPRSFEIKTVDIVDGRIWSFKDQTGTGAGTNNITITTEGSETIDGAATAVIDSDRGTLNIYAQGGQLYKRVVSAGGAAFTGDLAGNELSDSVDGQITFDVGDKIGWSGATQLDGRTNGTLLVTNAAGTAGFGLKVLGGNLMRVRNISDSGAGSIEARTVAIAGGPQPQENLLFNASNSGIQFGAGTIAGIRSGEGQQQFLIGVTATVGNHVVLGPYVHMDLPTSKDFDHPIQDDPTLFIHSDEDPGIDNTQWGSWSHDGSHFIGDMGTGGLKVLKGIGEFGSNPPAAQPSAIADVPTGGGATAAANATAINSILAVLRARGTIDT